MVNDSISDSMAQEAESFKGAGSKRDGDFCVSDSQTKKLKTEMNENQILESSSGNKSESGQGLMSSSERSTAKLSFTIEADAAEDKGSRHTMEDAWVVLQDASFDFPGSMRCAYFSIFDGHGGRLAAEYVQKNLHRNVLSAGLPLDCEGSKKSNT